MGIARRQDIGEAYRLQKVGKWAHTKLPPSLGEKKKKHTQSGFDTGSSVSQLTASILFLPANIQI